MTNVGRAAGAAVLSLGAATIGLGVGVTPADAAVCWPLASASIKGPSGTITAGSTVHASATVSGMLLQAHMQITGPGLDQQVGPSRISGVIGGDVRVPKPGVFTLTVAGNGTGCVYDSDAFTVKARSTSKVPADHSASAGDAARTSGLPTSTRGLGTPGSPSPFKPPPATSDGSGPTLRYPSADPQVAAPPVRHSGPSATNTAETMPPIRWEQSIAIALVLLLLSAHLGMWSRRQRLAESGMVSVRRRREARPLDATVSPGTAPNAPARLSESTDERPVDEASEVSIQEHERHATGESDAPGGRTGGAADRTVPGGGPASENADQRDEEPDRVSPDARERSGAEASGDRRAGGRSAESGAGGTRTGSPSRSAAFVSTAQAITTGRKTRIDDIASHMGSRGGYRGRRRRG